MNAQLSLSRPASLLKPAALALAGSLCLAISARIEVPFWPVPMTMQSLVVLLIGHFYGGRLGLATVLAYLAEGAGGLPVFAGGAGGIAVFSGPTGGYLAGFILCAALVGWSAGKGWTRLPLPCLAVMLAGHALIFLPGVIWLATFFGGAKAIADGFTPFIAATLLKTALAVAIAVRWRPSALTEKRS